MIQHYARLCWNDTGWTKPSGIAKDGPNTFFGQFGFGMEEWLFDSSAAVDGWQYGFLQPVNYGYKKHVGDLLSVRLYSIPGGGRPRREEFEIAKCEVLTPTHAARIHDQFSRAGRITRMIAEVRAVKGDPSPLQTVNPFFEKITNVRFRLSDVRKLRHRAPLTDGDYYHLYPVPISTSVEIQPTYPDEGLPGSAAWEGALKKVLVNVYERNRQARRECLAYWGYNCHVCGMSFAARYGPVGKEFIHVHHLVPLASVKKSYRVNGKEDLRPVCPNCHAMLHHGTPPPSIPELRRYFADARNADNAI